MSWKLLDKEQTFALFEYFLFEQIVKIRAETVQGSKNWVFKDTICTFTSMWVLANFLTNKNYGLTNNDQYTR
jgi:hypothetical protein